jgi:hypothetical protein
MPQPPKQLDPSRSGRHWFGAELRHWRVLRGLSQAQLGARVHVSGDLIGKIEKAVRACSAELARALDEALGTGGVLTRALARATADADTSPADADTSPVRPFPGPARPTPDAILTEDPPPPAPLPGAETLRVPCRTAEGRIIFVTMPPSGSCPPLALVPPPVVPAAPSVRDFLAVDGHPAERLRDLRRTLVRCDNVLGAGHVYDTARDHLRLIGGLVRQGTGADRRTLLHVQAEYAELCGWLCQDSGDERTARFWTDRALEWSHTAGQREAVAYVMVRKAQLAADCGDPADTADLAEAARELAPPRSRFAVMGALSAAYAHALNREAAVCHRTFDSVLGMLDQVADDPPARRGNWLDSPHVQAQRAQALSLLGEHESASDGFDRALRTLPSTYRRDRGYILSQRALAHLRADEPERAALAGLQALPIASATGSGRTFRALAALDGLLPAGSAQPQVREYRTAFDASVLHEA